jgi:hypothetical protein
MLQSLPSATELLLFLEEKEGALLTLNHIPLRPTEEGKRLRVYLEEAVYLIMITEKEPTALGTDRSSFLKSTTQDPASLGKIYQSLSGVGYNSF